MHITKIEFQKKRPPRYDLYADGAYLFSVSEDTLLHFRVTKGKEFNSEEIDAIQHFEQVNTCVEQAIRYLSRRLHLKQELRRKLRVKQFTDPIIDAAMARLDKLGYLNDQEFIRLFISDQIKLRSNGPLLIKKKLMEKGAPAELSEQILYDLYPEEKQLQQAQKLYEKRIKGKSAKEMEKALRHLQQKGFSWEVIRNIRRDKTED